MSPASPGLFDRDRLSPDLEKLLRSANPWWAGRPGRPVPEFKRWAFPVLLKKLEQPTAPIVVLRGPRQVGKSTLQEQLVEHLLRDGVSPTRILRVQFDELESLRGLKDPILALARWFEDRILGRTLNEAARDRTPAYLFFDEVQNLDDWAPQLKALVDHHSARVLVTGSSALRIEAGRDSLAGRIASVELGTLLLREIAGLRFGEPLPAGLGTNGLEALVQREFWMEARRNAETAGATRDRAFAAFSERGGYPLVHARGANSWAELAEQLNENVVRRVIQHDLRVGERGRRRDGTLLEEVFRLACRYAGQAPARAELLGQVQRVMNANVGAQKLQGYLRFLDHALLVKLVEPLELRLKKRRGAAKLCLVDHGLRAAWLQEDVPLDPDALERAPQLADIAGHLAESVVGAFFAGIPSLRLSHFPARPSEPEVDFVLTVGERRVPVEVKYRRRIDPYRDLEGLVSFLEHSSYNARLGILVTEDEDVEVADPRIVPISLRSLLTIR